MEKYLLQQNEAEGVRALTKKSLQKEKRLRVLRSRIIPLTPHASRPTTAVKSVSQKQQKSAQVATQLIKNSDDTVASGGYKIMQATTSGAATPNKSLSLVKIGSEQCPIPNININATQGQPVHLESASNQPLVIVINFVPGVVSNGKKSRSIF